MFEILGVAVAIISATMFLCAVLIWSKKTVRPGNAQEVADFFGFVSIAAIFILLIATGGDVYTYGVIFFFAAFASFPASFLAGRLIGRGIKIRRDRGTEPVNRTSEQG